MSTLVTATGTCLNCGAELTGKFCANCGQRDVPAYPTIHEMAHDAWHEISGWDGRFFSTFRALFRPGHLTNEILQGRRARYIKPIRLYLVASVAYFVIAASVPQPRITDRETGETRTLQVGLWSGAGSERALTDEERQEVERVIAKSPWYVRPLMEELRDGGQSLQGRVLNAMPKVLFGLVPVFAAILAWFFRRRRFTQHLIFSLHFHAMVFLVLASARAVNLVNTVWVSVAAGLVAMFVIPLYALIALRRVYGDRWPKLILKAATLGAIYGTVALATIFTVVAALAYFF